MGMDARQLSESQGDSENISSASATPAEILRDAPVATARPIARMLIIDDDPQVQRVLRRLLEAKGYVVDCTAIGKDAIGRLHEFAPDVVFLDVANFGAVSLDLLE